MQKLYGIHAVEAVLQTQAKCVHQVYIQESRQDDRLQSLQVLANKYGIPVKKVSRAVLETLVEASVRHQGVVIEVDSLKSYSENDLTALLDIQQAVFLVLDGVQDPHNLGACLRSANAFGVHAVIAPKDRAVGITPTVRKVACGAAELTPFIAVTNLARTLKNMKEQGVWVVGTSGDAEKSIDEIDLSGSVALVMGAEAKGMRRLTKENCDYLAAIPMLGSVESFNVSVATGICLYEIVRQRKLTS